MTRSVNALSLFVAISLAAPLLGAAPERGRVVVFGTEAGPAPAGFTQALAIQCAASAEVEAGEVLTGSVSAKLGAIGRPLAERRAAVGIWVERAAGSGEGAEFLVYVASRQQDRVLVQVVRLPGRDEPETDRALALKVREVLDLVLARGSAEVTRAVTPAPASARTSPAEPEAPARPPALSFVGFAGLALASAGNGRSDTELGASVGGGLRFGARSWLTEACLELRPMSGTNAEAASGSVRTREVAGLASFHALITAGGLGAGFELATGAEWVHATGTAPDGRTGEATRYVPFVYAGPEARLMFSSAVSLRLGAGLELALRRQRFSVLDREVVDLGSLRGAGDLSILASF